IAIQAKKEGFEGIILPEANAREAAIVSGLHVVGVTNRRQLIEHIEGRTTINATVVNIDEEFLHKINNYVVDFAEVYGQENIKTALEMAEAGVHYVIPMVPPRS